MCIILLSQSIKSDWELGAQVSPFNSTAEIELSPQVFQQLNYEKLEETGMPSDGGRGCCLTVAMSLTDGRVQPVGMDNDKVLTPCAFLEESYYSQHWKSEKFSAHNSCVKMTLYVFVPTKVLIIQVAEPLFFSKRNVISKVESEA